jgi:uncharacterized protein YcbK (DUF882 family)
MTSRLIPIIVLASSSIALSALLAGAAPHETQPAAAASRSAVSSALELELARSIYGHSGALRVVLVPASEPLDLLFDKSAHAQHNVLYEWQPVVGSVGPGEAHKLPWGARLQTPATPGIWRLQVSAGGAQHDLGELAVITKKPLSAKRDGHLNGYHVGEFPAATAHYVPPTALIEVTPENQEFRISTNFRLSQFLTKDQEEVWPKYVAIDLRLIDKLELVLQELKLMGVRADRLHVMSGFRTPQYNGPGGNGRALRSRHTLGDAADVWVENGEEEGMADLNGDGRIDMLDAWIVLQAVERVEQKYPELVGGAGVYRPHGARPPFVHIDVRGTRARW